MVVQGSSATRGGALDSILGSSQVLMGGQGTLSSEVSSMLPIVLGKLKARLTRAPPYPNGSAEWVRNVGKRISSEGWASGVLTPDV